MLQSCKCDRKRARSGDTFQKKFWSSIRAVGGEEDICAINIEKVPSRIIWLPRFLFHWTIFHNSAPKLSVCVGHYFQRHTSWFDWERNHLFQQPLVAKLVLSTALVSCRSLISTTTSDVCQDFLYTGKIDSLSQTELKSTIITDLPFSLFRLVRRSEVFHLRKADIENVVGLAPTAWTFTTASTCPGTAWWTPTICVHANEVSGHNFFFDVCNSTLTLKQADVLAILAGVI